MAGLATRIKIAEIVADSLGGVHQDVIKDVIKSNKSWYYFGALGPAIGDFVPSRQPQIFGSPTRTPYWSVWTEILKIAVGDEAMGLPGVVPVLRVFRKYLDTVSALIDDEDASGLRDFADSEALDELDQASADLGVILTQFSDFARLEALGLLMGSRSRPSIGDPDNLVPEALWTGRDWLHWKKTGQFVTSLCKKAEESGKDQFMAYAFGWLVSYATLVSSSGFVNSAVGSSYRTHWWRHRWVCNFIDTFVWGFYGSNASMSDDIPTPSFSDWSGLCNARLNELIDVTASGADYEALAIAIANDETLPELLPPEFTDFWLDAFVETYGEVIPALFTAEALQRGYAALEAVLWFQTSGEVIGCNPFPGGPPTDCSEEPDWTNPTTTNPLTEEPFQPAQPTPESDPDVAEIVSGAILALLGLATLFLGGGAFGIAYFAYGIKLIFEGAIEIDWDDLRCDIYWIEIYLHNGLTALHNLTVFGGVQHPYPRDLAVDYLLLNFEDQSVPYASGAAVCKSREIKGLRETWGGTLSTWTSYPTEQLEGELTRVWYLPGLWPTSFVDDDTINPKGSDIATPPPDWDSGGKSFGPAVQNALDLIVNSPDILPNWNLDGDRGLGWLTWKLDAPYTNPIHPVKES